MFQVDKEADSNTSNILLSEPIIDGAGEPEDDLETAQSHTLEVGIPNSNESDESDGDMEVDRFVQMPPSLSWILFSFYPSSAFL